MKNWVKKQFLLPGIPLWVVPSLLASATGTIWLRLSIVRTTYEISQTDQMIRNLREDCDQAALRSAALSSPRRLENLARTKYGLTQPKSNQIVYLQNGSPNPGSAMHAR